MNSLQISIKPLTDAVVEILKFIREIYQKEDDGLIIETELNKVFDEFNETTWVLIEYPYVDKVYRDSYYTYFASKHNTYFRDCIRVSFFLEKITLNLFRNEDKEKFLQSIFLGYLVIRPTFSCPIGRSLLDKRVFDLHEFLICTYTGNVAINGVKLNVSGFPHSSQDSETISCAETTIWSLMEYFGNRYPDYRPTYPSSIIEVLTKFSKQRLIPSNGLTVDQISFALKEFGFGTNIYSRDAAYEDEIENIIAYYVESGIPVIAAMQNEKVGHAIVIIGHRQDSKCDFRKVKRGTLKYVDTSIHFYDYTDIPKKYIVNDDNLPPYREIELAYPVEHYTADHGFDGCVIESVVVPLYKKIYLDVIKAKALALAILSDATFGSKFKPGFIFRFFLTSSRSLKEHVRRLPKLNPDQKDYIILSTMPKFVWCAEIFQKNDYQKDRVSGLIILDATEANQIWIDSLIFAGYEDKILVKHENDFVPLTQKLNLYQRFQNNLG